MISEVVVKWYLSCFVYVYRRPDAGVRPLTQINAPLPWQSHWADHLFGKGCFLFRWLK